MNIQENELAYLKLLSKQYPSIQAASTAMINLTAELKLPNLQLLLTAYRAGSIKES